EVTAQSPEQDYAWSAHGKPSDRHRAASGKPRPSASCWNWRRVLRQTIALLGLCQFEQGHRISASFSAWDPIAGTYPKQSSDPRARFGKHNVSAATGMA